MCALSQAIVKVVTCESTTQVWCLGTMLLGCVLGAFIYRVVSYTLGRVHVKLDEVCCVFHLDI